MSKSNMLSRGTISDYESRLKPCAVHNSTLHVAKGTDLSLDGRGV